MPHPLVKILHSLGNTPQLVATTLKGCGIQGVRNTVRLLNPIVRFVHRQLRADLVSLSIVDGALCMERPYGTKVKVTIPPSVCEFLEAFNQGCFPDLELPVQ